MQRWMTSRMGYDAFFMYGILMNVSYFSRSIISLGGWYIYVPKYYMYVPYLLYVRTLQIGLAAT